MHTQLPDFTHVTNQNDPVPLVPPQILSFQHPDGEIHITGVSDSGDATLVACPGQENSVCLFTAYLRQRVLTRKRGIQNCQDGNSALSSSVSNHLGPYFEGISFGGKACPA